ncbi:MAG: glutathione S-transferase N-terminal domain-containing protein [Thermoleophilaceae bacterium]
MILYRCRTPTNWLCRCGTVARALKKRNLDFEQVRVAQLRGQRVEIDELTGQTWVPVLVDGEEVIHDSHRILEYLRTQY